MTFFHLALRRLSWGVFLLSPSLGASAKPATVPQCVGVTLEAAYLAQVTPEDGPGFLLVIANNTEQPIKLARPFPTSAHWYAEAGAGRWLWRASSGAGGALANALAERGPVFAYPRPAGEPIGPPTRQPLGEPIVVAAHAHLELTESMRSSPVLRFRPGCERCRNPGDGRYRAVLAYAYLPGSAAADEGLLPCGLRSGPIVMPPLE